MLGCVGDVGKWCFARCGASGAFPMLGYVGMCWGCWEMGVRLLRGIGRFPNVGMCWDVLGMLGNGISLVARRRVLSQCWDMLGCVGDVGKWDFACCGASGAFPMLGYVGMLGFSVRHSCFWRRCVTLKAVRNLARSPNLGSPYSTLWVLRYGYTHPGSARNT